MSGFDNITSDESIMFADNASFDGTERGGKMTTDGQLWIGSTASPHVVLGSISAGTGITVTNGSGSISIANDGVVALDAESGSKVSSSGTSYTIKSPPYADLGISTAVAKNSGTFSTAAITLTLPVSGSLDDGDLCEFIASTSDVLTIQASGTQVINLGITASSAGGTCASVKKGDSISLRYQKSSDDWFATKSVGNWVLL